MSVVTELKKIMIIEDNPLNQKIASMIMDRMGHEVIQIFDGKGAYDIVKREKPQLVILDVMIPNISGIDICRAIKDDPELKRIPVIIVTAMSNSGDEVRITSESGCDDYLSKPFLPQILASTINKYIKSEPADSISGSK